MGFILPAIASAVASKLIGGGGQQQQQQLDFSFRHKPRQPQLPPYRYTPLPDNMANSFQAQIMPELGMQTQDPIMSAMLGGPEYSNKAQEKAVKGKEGFNFKDEILSSLTQNLVQRLIFGSGQQVPSYSPPSFR